MRLLTAFLSVATRATYFYLPEGEEKCFVEDVPADLYSTITYESLDPPKDPCLIEFRYKKKTLFSKGVDKDSTRGVTSLHVNRELIRRRTQGKSQDSLEINICIVCKGGQQHWWEANAARLRWQIKSELLFDPLLANQVTKDDTHEGFTNAEAKIRNLIARFESIYAENEYERKQEHKFRDYSESANSAVVTMNLIEIVLIFLVALFQIYHLRNYFKQQKLI